MARVLPVPAPARISTGPSVVSAARRCSGFRLSRKLVMGRRQSNVCIDMLADGGEPRKPGKKTKRERAESRKRGQRTRSLPSGSNPAQNTEEIGRAHV